MEKDQEERKVDIVNCLEEIKKDLRLLPCQSGTEEGCLQSKNIQELEKGLQEAHTAYILCHKEKLEPLIKSNFILNEKQDLQQKTIDRIEIKVDKIQEKVTKDLGNIQEKIAENRIVDKDDLKKLEIVLTNQITKIITQKETVKVTKNEVRNFIQWILGIIIASAAVYGIVKAIIAAFTAGIFN